MFKIISFVFFVSNLVLIESVNDVRINVNLTQKVKSCEIEFSNYTLTENSRVFIHTTTVNNFTQDIVKVDFAWLTMGASEFSFRFGGLTVPGKKFVQDYSFKVDKQFMEGQWTFIYLHSKLSPVAPLYSYDSENYTKAECSTNVKIVDEIPTVSNWIQNKFSIAIVATIVIAIIIICAETTLIIFYRRKVRNLAINHYKPLPKNGQEEDPDRVRYSADPAVRRKVNPDKVEETRESVIYECPEKTMLGLPPPVGSPPSIPSTPRPTHGGDITSKYPGPRTTTLPHPSFHRPNKDIEESIKNRPPMPPPPDEEVYQEADEEGGIYEEPPVPEPSTTKPSFPPKNLPNPQMKIPQQLQNRSPLKPPVCDKPKKPALPIGKVNTIPFGELNKAIRNRNNSNTAPSPTMPIKVLPVPSTLKPQPSPTPKPKQFAPTTLRPKPASPPPQHKPMFRQKPPVNVPPANHTPVVHQPPPVNHPPPARQYQQDHHQNAPHHRQNAHHPPPTHHTNAVHHPLAGHHQLPSHHRGNQPHPNHHQHYPSVDTESIYSNGEDGDEENPWNEDWTYEPITNRY